MRSLYLIIMPNAITASEAVESFSDVLSRAHDEDEEEFVWEKDGQVILRFTPPRYPLTGAEIAERLRRCPQPPPLTSEEDAQIAADYEEIRRLFNTPCVPGDYS